MEKSYDKETIESDIVAFRAKSATRECVDEWFNEVATILINSTADNKRVRLLYDLRRLDMVTPYSLRRAQELERMPVSADWRVATLVSSTFVANMVNYLITVSLMNNMRAKSHVFTSEKEALAWLRE